VPEYRNGNGSVAPDPSASLRVGGATLPALLALLALSLEGSFEGLTLSFEGSFEGFSSGTGRAA
jgi:hypothetical protein